MSGNPGVVIGLKPYCKNLGGRKRGLENCDVSTTLKLGSPFPRSIPNVTSGNSKTLSGDGSVFELEGKMFELDLEFEL